MSGFSPIEAISYRILRVHELTRAVAKDLNDEQLRHPASRQAPPIGFHLWHMARGTDRIQTTLTRFTHGQPESAEEIWQSKGLASRWNLEPESLGRGETGMEMDLEAAELLRLPESADLFGYMIDTFTALEGRLSRLTDAALSQRLEDFYGRDTNIGAFLLNHLSHMDRHLGMIEGLKGLLGVEGSATV